MRAEILSSESLSHVSLEADLVFRSLILVADDYGRMDGRIPVLRAALFPLRPSVTAKKLDRWIGELLSGPDAPVVSYVVDGRPYLALTGWEEHRGKSRRANRSKFPAPPEAPTVSDENDSTASPEIRENPLNPPEGMESRVEGMESREIPGEAPEIKSVSLCLAPERLSEEGRKSARGWAKANGFTEAQLAYGWQVVRDWSHGKGEKRVDWLAVLRNAMRDGWALEGFGRAERPNGKPKGQAYEEWRGYEAEDVGAIIDAAIGGKPA